MVFGATVDLEDEDTGAKVTYQIVGEDEADIKAGRISFASPDCACAGGQEPGRCRRGGGAQRQAQLRDDRRPLRLNFQRLITR